MQRLIDDLLYVSRITAALLRLAGHVVTMAHDGRAALAAADRFRPDVMLLENGLGPGKRSATHPRGRIRLAPHEARRSSGTAAASVAARTRLTALSRQLAESRGFASLRHPRQVERRRGRSRAYGFGYRGCPSVDVAVGVASGQRSLLDFATGVPSVWHHAPDVNSKPSAARIDALRWALDASPSEVVESFFARGRQQAPSRVSACRAS